MPAGEEIVNETNPQTAEVQQPEATPEVDTAPEEEEVTLPSDIGEFELPEKFQGKSAEEIAKAYVELEKKLGGGQNEQATPNETPPEPNEEVAEEQPNYLKEYIENGDLSEESYKLLEEKGYSREEVIDRLEFEKFRQEKQISELVEPIGGIEEYTKLNEWASENIPQEQIAAFYEEFKAAGPLAKKALIKDAYMYYKQSIGEDVGTYLHTNEPQTKQVKGYTSQHELQKDMSDPRYGVDRSYTLAVEEKVARSNLDKL
jgi:hypothetical protein